MCRAATCPECKRPTWKGCGAHVEQVLGHVPRAERCNCGAKATVRTASSTSTKRRWFSRSG